jgi:hypothetical protein
MSPLFTLTRFFITQNEPYLVRNAPCIRISASCCRRTKMMNQASGPTGHPSETCEDATKTTGEMCARAYLKAAARDAAMQAVRTKDAGAEQSGRERENVWHC